MTWTVILVGEVEDWFFGLDPKTADLVAAAINNLEESGPTLGRPLVDRVHDSNLHNLKELRPGSAGDSEVRILFAFDPQRQAVLLVGGDKSGRWKDWYKESIPLAEERFEAWINGYSVER
jgi:hypothetical protein